MLRACSLNCALDVLKFSFSTRLFDDVVALAWNPRCKVSSSSYVLPLSHNSVAD